MRNVVCMIKKNENYFIKNILNGCIIELNQEYYDKIKKKEENVFKELNELNFFSSSSTNYLSLMIMLSDACNLVCKYCFEKKHNKKNNLRIDDLSHIINFISYNFEHNSYDYIDITYTGGEPLLNKKCLYLLTSTGSVKNFV